MLVGIPELHAYLVSIAPGDGGWPWYALSSMSGLIDYMALNARRAEDGESADQLLIWRLLPSGPTLVTVSARRDGEHIVVEVAWRVPGADADSTETGAYRSNW